METLADPGQPGGSPDSLPPTHGYPDSPSLPHGSPDSPPPGKAFNRYEHQISTSAIEAWRKTFDAYDRDSGGDVDIRELGLMFRLLGHSPSEAAMQALIKQVDNDSSGTIDFTEFCLLMLQQQRQLIAPAWLLTLLHQTAAETPSSPVAATRANEGQRETTPRTRASHAALSKAEFDAATAIQRGMSVQSGKAPSRRRSFMAKEQHAQTEILSRDTLATVIDMLPGAHHIQSAELNGYGPLFGTFLAEELARSIKLACEHILSLEVAADNIGDRGAQAFARALSRNSTLTSLDLSANNIGGLGAAALLGALKEGRSVLTVLRLDDNLIPPAISAKIQEQLLINSLPHSITDQVKDQAPAVDEPVAPPTLDSSSVHTACRPVVQLSEQWLGVMHMPILSRSIIAHNIASLRLIKCPKFDDTAAVWLLTSKVREAAHGTPPPARPNPSGPRRTSSVRRVSVSSAVR